MNKEITTVLKKIDDTIIELKMMLEQVTDLRVKCAFLHVEILSSYQPISGMVLDVLGELERDINRKETNGAQKMEE